MSQQPRINLILLVLNILALSNFIYPCRKQFLLIIVFFIIYPLPYSIKLKMRTITLLSLIASFLCCVVALGLAINTAYQLDLTQGPTMINTGLSIGQIISFWSHQYLQKNTINRDITLMIFTLPNLFLCVQCEFSPITKTLYLIYPLFDNQWLYAVGFLLGIYTTSLIGIEKHHKFFIIAAISLIEAQFSSTISQLAGIFAFIRGMLIYSEQKHQLEKYFIVFYLFVKILYKDILFYFMFLGYLIIGVVILQQFRQKKEKKHFGKDESVGTQQVLNNEMYELHEFKLIR